MSGMGFGGYDDARDSAIRMSATIVALRAEVAALKAEVEYWREQAKAHSAARAAAIVEEHSK